MKKWLIVSMISIFLQGCYPVYKTIRIPVEIKVVDEKGQNLNGVKIVRMTDQTPARVNRIFDITKTNTQGFAKLEKQSKWQLESFIIHGSQHYTWTLCISKSGYETLDDIKLNPDQQMNVVFTLKKTKNKSEECRDKN